MMPASRPPFAASDLMARLPQVRGRLTANAPLDKVIWFQAGGPAEVMFKPQDLDDLVAFLKGKPADVPITVLGVGSNLLVRDGGVPGVVLRLGRAFAQIAVEGEGLLVGAAALDANVAAVAADAGLGGLAFLAGVPGTVGGNLRMNAGAYGGQIADVLDWAEAVDPAGVVHRLSPAEMGFAYRRVSVPADWIFVRARLKGTPTAPALIRTEIADIQARRGETQPVRSRTGGSTFANPDGHKAWQLIDAAGCRGAMIGGAQVSTQHCNFLINTGTATAADLEALGEHVRARVKATSGIDLRWEIRRIGVPAEDAQ